MKRTRCLELHKPNKALVKVFERGLVSACCPAASFFRNLNNINENLRKALKEERQ